MSFSYLLISAYFPTTAQILNHVNPVGEWKIHRLAAVSRDDLPGAFDQGVIAFFPRFLAGEALQLRLDSLERIQLGLGGGKKIRAGDSFQLAGVLGEDRLVIAFHGSHRAALRARTPGQNQQWNED